MGPRKLDRHKYSLLYSLQYTHSHFRITGSRQTRPATNGWPRLLTLPWTPKQRTAGCRTMRSRVSHRTFRRPLLKIFFLQRHKYHARLCRPLFIAHSPGPFAPTVSERMLFQGYNYTPVQQKT